MERKQITATEILDLLVAFDMVDHEILVQILEQKFSFCEKVNVNGKYSKAMDLEFSIPQGSCNGATIFTCYCSLINESVPSSVKLTGFADDHSIRKSFPAKCHKHIIIVIIII